MPAGFAALQRLETGLVQAGFGAFRVPWLLEMAPTASASPELPLERCRILVDASRCRWPFVAGLGELPLENNSVPAALLRHVWQPGIRINPLDEIARVLRPGGILVSVTANPWHRLAWRELGRHALGLPSWPQLQVMHARRHFELAVPAASQLRGFVPGLTPVLVLVARKPSEPARVEPIRFRQPRMVRGTPALSQCRAA
ncbi:MAG: class I SAM-dependent methyltransferase [Pseudomonadota bacterium]|nr:MAG: class I SAM-dependent methyltransferase [Pseudomonadota bacterium]